MCKYSVVPYHHGKFQAANNTAVMKGVHSDHRRVISGLLTFLRNLGLITGDSVMGAVFALASATIDITTARPEAVATGMRSTIAVAAVLSAIALALAVGIRVALAASPRDEKRGARARRCNQTQTGCGG